LLSLSSVVKLNELQRRPPKSLVNDLYITVMHVLSPAHSFNAFMFVLGQSILSCSQPSRPGGGEQSSMVIWSGLVLNVVHGMKLLYRPFNDLRWISCHIVAVCICLRWNMDTNIKETSCNQVMSSGALSYGTTVMPWSLGLLNVIND